MINLIPPEGHKIVRREHYARVLGTFMILSGVMSLAFGIALVPTYILVNAQIRTFEVEANKDSENIARLKQVEEEVKKTKTIIIQFRTASRTIDKSEAILEIEKQVTEEIAVVSMQFEIGKDGTPKVQLRGKALSRSALARFKERLEETELFIKAEVPISDLARDTDLQFAMTLTMQKS